MIWAPEHLQNVSLAVFYAGNKLSIQIEITALYHSKYALDKVIRLKRAISSVIYQIGCLNSSVCVGLVTNKYASEIICYQIITILPR